MLSLSHTVLSRGWVWGAPGDQGCQEGWLLQGTLAPAVSHFHLGPAHAAPAGGDLPRDVWGCRGLFLAVASGCKTISPPERLRALQLSRTCTGLSARLLCHFTAPSLSPPICRIGMRGKDLAGGHSSTDGVGGSIASGETAPREAGWWPCVGLVVRPAKHSGRRGRGVHETGLECCWGVRKARLKSLNFTL